MLKPMSAKIPSLKKWGLSRQWGTFYLCISDFFATQIKGGAKELVVLCY